VKATLRNHNVRLHVFLFILGSLTFFWNETAKAFEAATRDNITEAEIYRIARKTNRSFACGANEHPVLTGTGAGCVSNVPQQGGAPSGSVQTVAFDVDNALIEYNSGIEKAENEQTAKKSAEKHEDKISRFNTRDVLESGECANADSIGRGCSGTKMLVQGAQISNAVTQTAGSIATQVTAAQQMATNPQNQADLMRSAAKTQEMGGNIQMTTGTINAVLGAAQMYEHFRQKKENKEIQGATGANQTCVAGESCKTADELGNTMISQVEGKWENHEILLRNENQTKTLSAETAQEMAAMRAGKTKAGVKTLGNRAVAEKSNASQEAFGSGMTSLATGANQIAQGYFNKKAAEAQMNAADSMERWQDHQNSLMLGGGLEQGDAAAPNPGTVPVGDGEYSQSAFAEEDPFQETEGPTDLGPGLDPPFNGDPNGVAPGPAPTPFRVGGNGNPIRGGGGGGLGGGSTGADSGEKDDRGSESAGLGGVDAGYQGGSGYVGGKAGGGSKDAGMDLSGLLAKFLPKKEDDKNDDGILSYGGRDPAREMPDSILGKNANLFKRIHDRYQTRQKGGFVGFQKQ